MPNPSPGKLAAYRARVVKGPLYRHASLIHQQTQRGREKNLLPRPRIVLERSGHAADVSGRPAVRSWKEKEAKESLTQTLKLEMKSLLVSILDTTIGHNKKDFDLVAEKWTSLDLFLEKLEGDLSCLATGICSRGHGLIHTIDTIEFTTSYATSASLSGWTYTTSLGI